MPKRIVLFADGTGNSRAAQFRTNVWKMYDALDLTPGGDQIAYYHDGVGTSAFAPLKILGSVFGFGVAANVRTLYAFLCRNYEVGDDIYIFGFSRGAFTARLLAALISHMGVPSLRDDAEIDRRAAHALSDYRRHRNRPRYGRVRRGILAGWERLTRPFSRPPVEQLEPARRRVAFVGVWDTVSAYGGPIVETVRAWDRWVFPLSFADYELPANVECARHALSLDEEREAFAPLLWNETRSGARIRQVWFAGVHSDVGGGYPDQGLSNVPLLWMMDEVASAPAGPLRFVTESRDRIRREANLLGPRHDSRSGVAIGYRYQPRWLSTYAQPSHGVPSRDPATGEGVMLMTPTVHSSVIERQRHGLDGYAPIVLPQSFADTDGGAHSLDPGLQRHVVRLSLRRRRLQFMLLLTGSLMMISPGFRSPWSQDFYDRLAGPAEVVKPLLWLGYAIDYLNQMLGKVVHGVIAIVPGLPDWVADAYASSGGYLLLGALALLVIVRRSASAAQRIEQESQAMWRVPSYPQAALPPSAWSRFWWPLRRFVRWRFAPNVIGIGYWLVMAWALVALVNQVSLSLYTRDPHWCPEGARSNVFHTRERCHALHQQVYEGQAFHLQIAVPPTPSARWVDEPTEATPAGFTYLDSLGQQIAARSPTGIVRVTFAHLFGTALRQNISERWFMPIVAIRPTGTIVAEDAGRAWVRTAPVRMQAGDDGIYRGTFIAPTSGKAYLYINDVTLPFMPWQAPAYDDNCGWAYVRLTPAYRRRGGRNSNFTPNQHDMRCAVEMKNSRQAGVMSNPAY